MHETHVSSVDLGKKMASHSIHNRHSCMYDKHTAYMYMPADAERDNLLRRRSTSYKYQGSKYKVRGQHLQMTLHG